MSGREVYYLLFCLVGVKSFPHQDSPPGVVGGNVVNITDAPFMARYFGRHVLVPYFCGASIIHVKLLATTATCYYTYGNASTYVSVGTDITKSDGEIYDVDEGLPHPRYNSQNLDYDVAVLRLAKDMKFSDTVKHIALASKTLVIPEGAMLDSYGFGSTISVKTGVKIPHQLQKASLPHISFDKCKPLYTNLTQRMLCAGAEGKGDCIFDEGGPLVYKGVLLGIISFAQGCGLKEHPTIFTSIPGIRSFMNEIIKTET